LSIVVFLILTPPAAGQYGAITFENSGPPTAQEAFLRGVLLLHSFEYGPSAEAFREAQRIAPDFALAYWGEAMTYNHPVWFQQDREAARAVLARLGATPEDRLARAPTERERDYLRAVEILYGDGPKASRDTLYAEAMQAMMARYPDDPEAAAFTALALLGTSHGGRHIPTYMRAAAIAEEVFRDNPSHPGAAHYMIHSYDDPVHAPLGLRAARAYARIAPAASHAQHMTSHIFIALGMWNDVVAANEVSFAVSGDRNYHGLYWLAYAYLQQGRYDDALARLRFIRARPRPGKQYLVSMWATHVVATRAWDHPGGVSTIDMTDEERSLNPRGMFASGLLALHAGDIKGARRWADALQAMADRRRPDAVGDDPALLSVEAARLELSGAIRRAEGDDEGGLADLRAAAATEDRMPFEFGPPVIVKPTHEMLGEALLELGRAEEARGEFKRALELAPRRALSLLGLARAAEQAGHHDRALVAYRTLHAIWANADRSLPERSEVDRALATDAGSSR